ncbi:MAG TPA: acylphosphatase [Bacteroidales bacterium]|nr:acylphosphatase [Bacteroidales bacterium]
MKHLDLTIKGRVQRVGFRFSAMEAAYRYSIRGVVMNSGDSDVMIEAEGTPENLDKFLAWCKKGPIGARVENVHIGEGQLKDYQSFEIVSRT